jgi:hypothetical protein
MVMGALITMRVIMAVLNTSIKSLIYCLLFLVEGQRLKKKVYITMLLRVVSEEAAVPDESRCLH